jgi:hypothetical protein
MGGAYLPVSASIGIMNVIYGNDIAFSLDDHTIKKNFPVVA